MFVYRHKVSIDCNIRSERATIQTDNAKSCYSTSSVFPPLDSNNTQDETDKQNDDPAEIGIVDSDIEHTPGIERSSNAPQADE